MPSIVVFVETRDGERRYVTLADTPRLALALHRPDALPVDGWGARAILRRLRDEVGNGGGRRPFVLQAGTEVDDPQAPAVCRCAGCRAKIRDPAPGVGRRALRAAAHKRLKP